MTASETRGAITETVRPAGRRSQGIPPALTQLVRDLAGGAVTQRALFVRLADTARDLTGSSGSAVLEATGESYRVIAPSGTPSVPEGHVFPIKDGPSIFREAFTTRRATVSNDAFHDPRVHPDVVRPLGVHQMALAPILVDDQPLGLLVCVNPESGCFTEDDARLLEDLAAHGSLVLRSQQLITQARDAATEARARAEDAARAAWANALLAQTARAFADAGSRDALYATLRSVLVDELQASGFGVYEANPRQRTAHFDYQVGIGDHDACQIVATMWRSPLASIVEQARPVFVEDVDDGRAPEELVAAMRRAGIGATALLPLVIEERPQGLLSVRYAGTHRFAADEQRLLSDIATQFALAFRNIRHVDELERRATRLTVLARAQQQLTQLASEESLPGGIAEVVQQVVPAVSCDVLVATANEWRRVVRLEQGQPVSSDLAPLADLALVRATADTGHSRLATHLEAGPDVVRGTTELCAAVRFGTRSGGVIRLLARPEAGFDGQDLDLLTILARHAGTAVETARLFALQDLQRQRAEGAAELARASLQAASLGEGAAELLHLLDRLVPSIGKAIGVVRAREAVLEFVAGTGTLDGLRGRRHDGAAVVDQLAPNGKPAAYASLHAEAPEGLRAHLPDQWALVIPLAARGRTLGVLLVAAPRQTPLLHRDRVTLERLSSSLALALDALLLDEDERLAREREHLLASAITTINHPIFILDRVGVRYANPAAAREYGWSQTELMDMHFEQLVIGADARQGLDVGSGVVEPGVQLSHDLHRRRDGSEFPAAVTVSPLTAADGDLLGQVVSVRNISQDRRLEEQLRHTEKMVALGELVAGVAHEINNPLTGISAFAQLLLEDPLEAEQLESVQLIKQESDRAKRVINDLLLFARKAEPGAGPVDINGILEQTVRLRAYPLRNANVQVRLALDPSAPTVTGDASKLQQVFLNVIGNAEFAMRDRTERTLTLSTARDGDRVVITARDTGEGMTADVQRRIFEPFFSTKPAGTGTGLGLSVSYGIISAHGGSITVASEPDVGTLVTLVLPAIPA